MKQTQIQIIFWTKIKLCQKFWSTWGGQSVGLISAFHKVTRTWVRYKNSWTDCVIINATRTTCVYKGRMASRLHQNGWSFQVSANYFAIHANRNRNRNRNCESLLSGLYCQLSAVRNAVPTCYTAIQDINITSTNVWL